MSNVPSELRYTKTHEWVRQEEDGTMTVGITEHAQGLLGDMVYVELPEAGTELTAGDECGVVESVKAASDVYSPLSGEILEANDNLSASPDLVNKDPFGEGWIFKMKPMDESALGELMDADAYTELCDAEGH